MASRYAAGRFGTSGTTLIGTLEPGRRRRDDYKHWLHADRQVLRRINRLVDDALRDPTEGIGKPEPLKHMLAGAWSRRITEEHRLVYLVDEDDLVILQARFQYR